jgi:hypothetical protein
LNARKPPVLDWASSASPRAGKRARIRIACLQSSPMIAFACYALSRSPAQWPSVC